MDGVVGHGSHMGSAVEVVHTVELTRTAQVIQTQGRGLKRLQPVAGPVEVPHLATNPLPIIPCVVCSGITCSGGG